MDIFKKHQLKYFQTLINAYNNINKKHGNQLNPVMTEIFYYSNSVNVKLTFTNKNKLLKHEFMEV